MSRVGDSLAQRHQEELARLRRFGRFSASRIAVFALTLFIVVAVLFSAFARNYGDSESLDQARHDLLSSGISWTQEFSSAQEGYRDWLVHHGIGFEVAVFDGVSEALFHNVAAFALRFSPDEELGFLPRAYLSIHGGIIRITFILLASWRLWLVFIGAAIYFSLRSVKVYNGLDALGMTGNGRIFFSGARIALDEVTEGGAPQMQVTGLACPAAVPLAAARNSEIAKVLERFSAMNKTNLALVSIIEKHRDYPAYVSEPGDEEGLSRFFEGAALGSNAKNLLENALKVHQGFVRQAAEESELIDSQSEPSRGSSQKVSAAEYVSRITNAFVHTVTPSMQQALASLPAYLVATTILALEAGKVLAYSYAGGKWIKRSNFPQLCARAVLHSLPSFSAEYDFDVRQIVRRALIFGSRSSLFAPVKFPIDLSEDSRALRQWVELLLAVPHELTAVEHEVELIGLLHDLHRGFEHLFFDRATALDPELIEGTFASNQRMLFIPLPKLVKLLKRVAADETLARLTELVSLVSQQQKLKALNRKGEGDDEKPLVPSYERVFPPFTQEQINQLAETHQIPVETLKSWSALRVVLNAYGWLGRRVSDRSVPESSLIFAVFEVEAGFPGANKINLLGLPGMVPLRATRLEEQWGRVWGARFTQVTGAKMAETRADFERILAGIDDEAPVDGDAQGAQPPNVSNV